METREEKLKAFLEENKHLFWYLDKTKLHQLSDDVIVEFILNYGNEKSVKRLLEIMGINHVAEVFYRHIAMERRAKNYFPRTRHFFDLYFKHNAQGNTKQKAA